jgi:hypothetical protein
MSTLPAQWKGRKDFVIPALALFATGDCQNTRDKI